MGLLALAAGYAGLALAPAEQMIFYAIIGFIGLVASASGPAAWTRGVVLHFRDNRGAAFGLAMCGTSIISTIVIPPLSTVIAQGAEADFIAFFARRYFPLTVYSRVYALVSTGGYMATAAGGFLFALTYDRFGGYGPAIALGSLCYLLAATGILMIDRLGRHIDHQPLISFLSGSNT